MDLLCATEFSVVTNIILVSVPRTFKVLLPGASKGDDLQGKLVFVAVTRPGCEDPSTINISSGVVKTFNFV